MKKTFTVIGLLLCVVFLVGQATQGVYIHRLLNGETVEIYAETATETNGAIFADTIRSPLDSQGDGTGTVEMAIGPKTITDATNATPIIITSVAHGYSNGDHIFISGITVNTNANGNFKIANKADDTYELTDYGGTDIAGNGVYGAGGTSFLSFVYAPGATEEAVIHGLVGFAHDATYVSTGYLGVAALTNGVSLEVRDATSQVFSVTGANVKKWLQWSLHADLVTDNGDGGAGTVTFALLRWTFNLGPGNLRVDGTQGHVLVMVIKDDLTGLLGQQFNVQGRIK